MGSVTPVAERSVRMGGATYPVRLPSTRDPRLHLAVTITSIQVLGQAFLGWELSIAQILVCLGTCAVLEVGIVLWESRVIAWPASALLTGNGVALVLRVNGTEHGDWWSLHGWYIFAATSALALVSKHVIRYAGRPVVNPSNLGLVVCFVVLGTGIVNPLDFWWGPMSVPMVAVYLILFAGAMVVTRRLHLLPMSLTFWAVFAAALGVLTAGGHCISARWSVQPVCGAEFWWIVVTSPEVLIFMLFMITDPMTSPRGPGHRVVFGAAVGLASALLVAPMQTEFGAKVGVLAGLVAVCVLRPVVSWVGARVPPSGRPMTLGRPLSPAGRLAAVTGVAAAAVPLLLLAGTPARDPVLPGTSAAVSASVLSGRPDVTPPAGSLPVVTLSDEVESVVGQRASQDAEQMAQDLAADLLIEADAVRRRDPALAATALAGRRLEEAEQQIADGGTPPSVHTFSAMTVVLVRDAIDPQAVPRFGLHAVGTRAADGTETPFDRVFVLQEVSGVWLLTDEVSPGGT